MHPIHFAINIIIQKKPKKILIRICPDNILANNLTDKLTTRVWYEINSTVTNKGAIAKGVPAGKIIVINSIPCNKKPIKFKIKKLDKAKVKEIITLFKN